MSSQPVYSDGCTQASVRQGEHFSGTNKNSCRSYSTLTCNFFKYHANHLHQNDSLLYLNCAEEHTFLGRGALKNFSLF